MINLQMSTDGDLLRFGSPSGELQGQCICQEWHQYYNLTLDITDGTCLGYNVDEPHFEQTFALSTADHRPNLGKCTYYLYLYPDTPYWGAIEASIVFEIIGGANNEVEITFFLKHNSNPGAPGSVWVTVASGSLTVQDVELLCGSMVCGSMADTYIVPFDTTGVACPDGSATIVRV